MAYVTIADGIALTSTPDLSGPVDLNALQDAMQAAAQGIGKTLLPRSIASSDPRFQEIELEGDARYPTREGLLLSHVDQLA